MLALFLVGSIVIIVVVVAEVPKLKTNSSAKKRFKFSANSKVIMTQSGKRHGMRKRSPSMIRSARGTVVANSHVTGIVRQCFPYGG